jgi:choline dehydrogenase-like flavoprotein
MAHSNRQLQALAAVCDTFIANIQRADDPHGYWKRTASDNGVPERILQLMQSVKAEDQAAFGQLLDLISSPLLGLTWGGPLKPAHRLTPEQRERMLHAWAGSRVGLFRNAYSTLRKASCMLFFGDVPAGMTQNPCHPAVGYALPELPPIPDPNPLPVLQPEQDTLLDCEVLIIGSGSGGGVAAGVLSEAGRDVIVVEKGPYDPRPKMTMQEFPMLNRHFESGALLATQSGSVSVMAGSTMGGGSAINWAGTLRTPDYVLEEWAKEHDNPHFLDPAYRAGFEAIETRHNVSDQYAHNPQNQSLFDAAKKLGWHTENIPMNLRIPEHVPAEQGWQAIGFSCLNDAHGIKQGVQETFLRDAAARGTRLLARTTIEKITVEQGRATGAEGYFDHPNGQRVRLRILAKKVIVSAGALHTPVLLQKSGLRHPQIGQNLYLHPVIPTVGLYDTPTTPWYGPMMSVIVKEFERLDGNWGFRLECPPVHPGLGAFAMSWENSAALKADLLQIRQLAVHICLVRDKFGGKVTVGKKSGQPVVHYEVHPFDRNHLVRAMQRSTEAHLAANARRISILHNRPFHYFPGQSGDLASFQQQIAQKNWGSNHAGVFSAHQMGTCRMGGHRNAPVQPDGQTREVKNLYVADASLFPSASGSNPMLSVQALAWYVAKQVF